MCVRYGSPAIVAMGVACLVMCFAMPCAGAASHSCASAHAVACVLPGSPTLQFSWRFGPGSFARGLSASSWVRAAVVLHCTFGERNLRLARVPFRGRFHGGGGCLCMCSTVLWPVVAGIWLCEAAPLPSLCPGGCRLMLVLNLLVACELFRRGAHVAPLLLYKQDRSGLLAQAC